MAEELTGAREICQACATAAGITPDDPGLAAIRLERRAGVPRDRPARAHDQPGGNDMTALAEHLTDADPVRDHVRQLREHGASYEAIGNAAGVGAMTVHDLMNSDGQVTTATSRALLVVTTQQVELRRVHAGGATWRLRSLLAMGHGAARISRALGAHPETVQKLVRGTTPTVSPELAGQVRALWEAWWDRTPPRRTRADRTAASAALRRAARNDWPCPLGLDEDEIDDPGYRPLCGWRPALGRGVAPDIT